MASLSPTTVHALLTMSAGFALGFVGSVPITGPVALVVLSRAADRRYRTALQIGIGGACAEALYAAIAYLAFGVIRAHRPELMTIARAVSGIVLTIVGLVFLLRPTSSHASRRAAPLDAPRHGVVLGFSISAFNPTLLGTWATAVGVLHARRVLELAFPLAIPFGLAAGLGIVSWELVLISWLRSSERGALRRALPPLVRAIGALVFGIGLWTGIEAFRALADARP